MHMWKRVRQRGWERKSDLVCMCVYVWEREGERECAKLRTLINASLYLLPQQSKVRANQNKSKADASREERGAAERHPISIWGTMITVCGELEKWQGRQVLCLNTISSADLSHLRETPRCPHLLDNWTFSGYWNPQINTCNMSRRSGVRVLRCKWG